MPLDNGPVDYRQLQAPVQPLSPDQLPSTGAAQEAEALAGLFRSFSNTTNNLGIQVGQTQGKEQGEAAGASGVPSLKQGIARYTAFGQAYNNAAIGAFLTESEIHAEDTASKLRVQANNDPAAFAKMYGAAADAVVKEAPAQVQGAMRDLYNRHMAAGVSALSGSQALEIQQTQRTIYDQGTERAVSRVAILQGSPNAADQAAAVEEHAKLIARIDGGVQAGLYSRTEADAKIANSMREITGQVFSTSIDHALADMANGGSSKGVTDLLENFRKAHVENLANPNEPAALSEAEYQKLSQDAKSKLQQFNIARAYETRDGKTAEQLKLEKGDVEVTVAMASHMPLAQLSQLVSDRVSSGDLKPEVGRAVLSFIQRGFDEPVDKRALYFAEHDPDRFNWGTKEIMQHAGGNAAQASQLSAKIASEKNSWESHDQIKDAIRTVMTGLRVPQGEARIGASTETLMAGAKADEELMRQLNALPPDKRDEAAPRIANNVVFEAQAQQAAAKAAQALRLDVSRYAPGGSKFSSDADYAARQQQRKDLAKQYQDEAEQLRSRIQK